MCIYVQDRHKTWSFQIIKVLLLLTICDEVHYALVCQWWESTLLCFSRWWSVDDFRLVVCMFAELYSLLNVWICGFVNSDNNCISSKSQEVFEMTHIAISHIFPSKYATFPNIHPPPPTKLRLKQWWKTLYRSYKCAELSNKFRFYCSSDAITLLESTNITVINNQRSHIFLPYFCSHIYVRALCCCVIVGAGRSQGLRQLLPFIFIKHIFCRYFICVFAWLRLCFGAVQVNYHRIDMFGHKSVW